MRDLRLIPRLGLCCLLIGLGYLIVLRAGLFLWNSPLNPYMQPGLGLDPRSALFLAVLLILVPYLVGRIHLGLSNAAHYALPVGLVTTILERLFIFALAAFMLGQFRRVTETGQVTYVEGGPDIVAAITSEALPYFDWGYILLGLPVSTLILYFTARGVEQFRSRSRKN